MPTIDAANLEVRNNREANRFEVTLGNEIGLIAYEYRKDEPTYIFTHTEVPPDYAHQGIADRMAAVALETAKAEGAHVVPLCPFVSKYIHKHPQYQSLVTT